MKLLLLFSAFLIFHHVRCSPDLIDKLKSGLGKAKDAIIEKAKDAIFDDEDRNESFGTNESPIVNTHFLTNRTVDYCSFTKIEKKVEEHPDPEECNKINEGFKSSEHSNFINYFGEMFNLLRTGTDFLKFPNREMKALFFVGNSGSGKTTLVQILGGDNSKIYSRRPNEHSIELIIQDDSSKIGVDTVTSQTLYPDLLVDKETGYVLCDNPGFRDTRSPIHEIIAVHGMRKVLKHTKKIKVVIIANHPSLQVGMYRDDFPNLLEHLIDLFINTDKYKESMYLIGNKVPNSFIMVKGNPKFTSDFSIIQETGHFLSEVKKSFNDKSHVFNITTKNKEIFFKKSVKIIDSLLEKENENYTRISILRRPAEEGPLSDIAWIQEERKNIRDMLLNENNMVEVEEGDFGFPLTDSAVLYLNDVFKKMNSYITDLSRNIGEYMMIYYTNLINSKTDIYDAINFETKMKIKIRELSNDVGKAQNPEQYAEIMSNFSDKNKLNLDCLIAFKYISTLNEYLTDLEGLSDTTKYTPLAWNMSMKQISDFIENKEEQYSLLLEIFRMTSTRKFQKNRHSYAYDHVNKNNFKDFLTDNELSYRYELTQHDDMLQENINTILNVTLKHKQNIFCQDETLVFEDYFVLLSEFKNDYFKLCENASTIVIFAMHTLFIDDDFTDDWVKGKELKLIAPIWEVVGTRIISVEGMSGGSKMPKAGFGVIGMNGKSGKPGGTFFGIGMHFNNEINLKISANGGNGQDGQDGGDGKDGESGTAASDTGGNLMNVVYEMIYPIFGYKTRTYIAEGTKGSAGGHAGAGGIGGVGGAKGSVVIHNVGVEPHNITILENDGVRGKNGADGKPGKGGIRGCDRLVKKKEGRFFFIQVYESTVNENVNCFIENPSGAIRRKPELQINVNNTTINNDSPICIHIMNFENYYLNKYHHLLSDGTTMKFINDMKQRKY